jgi:hypothetical protein
MFVACRAETKVTIIISELKAIREGPGKRWADQSFDSGEGGGDKP